MTEVHKQAADQAASDIMEAFKALRRDGVPPKRALELARIRARQDTQQKAKTRAGLVAALSNAGVAGSTAAGTALYDRLRGFWSFLNASGDRQSDAIGAIANASFRELMLLYSPNPRDRIHAKVKGEGGHLRIDVLDQQSDFVIKDWLWTLLNAFRRETGGEAMPADGLAKLNDALEIGFSLSSTWRASCWRLRLVFRDVEAKSAGKILKMFSLISTGADLDKQASFLATGTASEETWEPTEHRSVICQREKRDGALAITVDIDSSGRIREGKV